MEAVVFQPLPLSLLLLPLTKNKKTTVDNFFNFCGSVACLLLHFIILREQKPLFSCLSLARFLILLLLLMNGNVYPNPCLAFPCSVCAEYVTWQGRSVQYCTCSNWVHLKCSLLSFPDSELLAALTPGAALSDASLLFLEIPYLPAL